MSTAPTAAHTDSGLSGQPSDNIDQQRGPSSGSNVESPGGTFAAMGVQSQSGSDSSKQGSSGQNQGGQHQ